MTRFDTLKTEFKACKGPFPYSKLVKLLEGLGYEVKNGKGSKRKFVHKENTNVIIAHESHPGNEIKYYLVKQIRDYLVDRKEL
ncbi:type II toxin-antitoxin system HicA family toxin [Agrobacterium rosae]|uniref:type II toxin-antitoxin system HicA family toxin n=1 Tax=Agrobacterium rosae TaxID=1972867 RepID=UPI002034789A|nr:type II toxin-antitoxin system HicA family toxin [Agrobacterium rosae]MCM2434158.1 type II toxin-antitoxin system HicA family toxin [Agrobacterium rosae]